ncbi:MAG: hypothetical protein HY709_00615 [Candidatus Latescibacteria bacterium]|nr:hypothetical protein [Candidatus Latescibacterota bacterium]
MTQIVEAKQSGFPTTPSPPPLIDPQRRQAEFYRLDDDGIFRPAPVGDDDIFRSTVLDSLWLDVNWLWQRPLPSLLSVLKEWRLI